MTERVNPLSICLAVTLTPGTTAPLASCTMPTIAAEKPCPHAGELAKAVTPRIPTNNVAKLARFSLLLLTMTLLSLLLRCHRLSLSRALCEHSACAPKRDKLGASENCRRLSPMVSAVILSRLPTNSNAVADVHLHMWLTGSLQSPEPVEPPRGTHLKCIHLSGLQITNSHRAGVSKSSGRFPGFLFSVPGVQCAAHLMQVARIPQAQADEME